MFSKIELVKFGELSIEIWGWKDARDNRSWVYKYFMSKAFLSKSVVFTSRRKSLLQMSRAE